MNDRLPSDAAGPTATERNVLLRVSDLDVSYGAIRALHGVSLDVRAGEIVTLIGSNGAGKTTLLRTISGLLKPNSGRMEWLGDRGSDGELKLNGLKPHTIVHHGIVHVPEGRQVFPHLSVRDNLLLGAYQRRDKDQIAADVEQAYERFPILRERKDQKSGTLSGGEQQMLAIARALMSRPKLLLLDEPSLGLAPLIVRRIFDIIKEINAAGVTIFLVEQNAHMALTIADRAYVLQCGEVVRADAASKLLQDDEVKKAYLGG
ncbi:MAG TPA: ABC transporter ATP-binding protein [Tepidisphaeraceae bacterium]|jgi:branched-chain amino acid transport system ATP-binding protein|nr:ABC transporter ATP-binding protein [Tepidisphaeraceae bacterium]